MTQANENTSQKKPDGVVGGASSVNEGTNATFTLTTTNVASGTVVPGTVVPYTISGS